jgi:DnaJ-class molecular chaperone
MEKMNYFKDCKTEDDVKRIYRELAKKLHPDHGGSDELMRELTKQYESWIPANKFSQSSTMSEEEFQEKFKKASAEARFESNSQYAGYGGYRYANVNDMKKEYFKQSHDPRLADYERMKSSYEDLKKAYQIICHEQKEYFNLNEKLKKKIARLEKKLKQPTKAKKSGKDSVISL